MNNQQNKGDSVAGVGLPLNAVRTGDEGAELLPCPFCGKAHTATMTLASEHYGEYDDETGEPLPYEHGECYAVMCDASRPDGPGGCGASGGFFPTEPEAIAAWNRRSAPPEVAPAQPDDESVICPACCHQFRAIPVQVQQLMLGAGFEPPFMVAPAPSLGGVSVPGETAAGAQKQDQSSEIAELEQEASLMRARNERLQQERDAAERNVLLRVIQRLNGNPYNLTKSECIAEVEAMRNDAIAKAGGAA